MSELDLFTVSHVVVGDELGLIKKLEISSDSDEIASPKVVCVNRDVLDQPSPDKAILTIRRFVEPYYLRNNLTEASSLDKNENLFLICSKANRLQLYNANTDELDDLKPSLIDNRSKLTGSVPFRKNFIVNCYQNGSIYLQNIEKEMIQYASDTNKKALKVLGLDMNNNSNGSKSSKKDKSNNKLSIDDSSTTISNKKTKNKEDDKGIKKGKFSHHDKLFFSNRQIYSPNLCSSDASIDCFELEDNYLAVGGKNHDLKVFNLEREECIFTAKPLAADWLGLTAPVYLSGCAWLGKYPSNLIATTTRNEPIIRIYDLRTDGKAIMSMNMKEKSSFHSNPPVFSSICSTRSVFNENANNHQLIVGSTVGRMIAIDLRLNTQTYRTISSFKGFGGSIRDIKHIPETKQKSKIITCCLDRFVRVHNFETGFEKSKELKGKYYLKTKLTCLQPIFTDTCDEQNGSDNEE